MLYLSTETYVTVKRILAVTKPRKSFDNFVRELIGLDESSFGHPHRKEETKRVQAKYEVLKRLMAGEETFIPWEWEAPAVMGVDQATNYHHVMTAISRAKRSMNADFMTTDSPTGLLVRRLK